MSRISKQAKADFSLLSVAFVWGVTFVVIQDALSDITPHYFNAIRFFLAFLFLAAVYHRRFTSIDKSTFFIGVFIGIFLFSGYAFQTVGLQYTTASKSGFITGLAVVLVPVLTAFILRRMPTAYAIIGVISATVGLGLLSLDQGINQINFGDILTFFCALSFGLHITMVGKFAPNNDTVLLTLIQIATVTVISLIFGIFTETVPKAQSFTQPVWIALMVTAIPATALAYLIQNNVQKFTTPTHTAIIFTMEPVFAALTAIVLAGEVLTTKQFLGCGLILVGMLAAELKGTGALAKITE
ncbi:MAG: DMT family transporter [Firmicutes bacterium]|nr:DMT family transporter [Bacillota bacterium]